MSRNYFHIDEKKLQARIYLLKEMVEEIRLEETPCILLRNQLNEFEVLCSWLLSNVKILKTYVDKAIEQE